ncbi:DUF418 domain-containing protein [Quadrisphaera sp. DSM 44207]|uniref:DUF418 domain-containing protein n=1 Tax=Quadrisphaera sp. DSM 44207 TaxID=1881057 RepID=UPI00088931D7|nr:DUF418 domain-containing protein [Quadrisphaera sp. DSM 44207]SDQ07632.1 Uncharacterized membrane protein YeiB [Quadrisphaera sp. DSM 44207]
MPQDPPSSTLLAAGEPITGAPAPVGARSARIDALDVLRGFALCGILLVNAGPVTRFQHALEPSPVTLEDPSGWLQLLVQQRFFPIFSLLFGVGSSLFLASAARRATRPRVLLARRLLVLLPLGGTHQLLHPGEALTPYAVVGLLVLLPSSWLPRWAVAAGAAVLVPAALATGGGIALVPGLFLLGSALVRYGVVDRLETSTRGPLLLLLGFAAAAAPAAAWQLEDLERSGFTASSAVAGLLTAGVYVTGLLVLLRTPVRSLLQTAFVPLGRTALTTYVSATVVLVLAGHLLDLPSSRSWTVLLLVAGVLLVAQWAFSTWWLRHFTQGPLEWLWRWATWGRRSPLRRSRAATGGR